MKQVHVSRVAQIGLAASIAVTVAIAALTSNAQAPAPFTPGQTSPDQLILRAARGEYPATGEVTGFLADKIKGITKSNEPLVGSAWRIGKLSQEGCWRVRLSLYQEKVPTKDGGFAPFNGGFDLNICEDGDAPFPS